MLIVTEQSMYFPLLGRGCSQVPKVENFNPSLIQFLWIKLVSNHRFMILPFTHLITDIAEYFFKNLRWKSSDSIIAWCTVNDHFEWSWVCICALCVNNTKYHRFRDFFQNIIAKNTAIYLENFLISVHFQFDYLI